MGLVPSWRQVGCSCSCCSCRSGDPGALFVRPDGSGTLCTQAHPCDLQTALSQAVSDDTLYLAGGVRTGSGTAVVAMTKSIALYGGWDGTTSTPQLRDPAIYPTALGGENGWRGVCVGADEFALRFFACRCF